MQNVFPEFLSVQLKERKQEGRGGRSVSRIWPENQAKRGSGGDFTDHANISTIYSKVEILNRNVDVQQQLNNTSETPFSGWLKQVFRLERNECSSWIRITVHFQSERLFIFIRIRNLMSGILFLVEKDGSGAYFSRTRDFKGQIHVTDAADLLTSAVHRTF